jgi:hypothetical protein
MWADSMFWDYSREEYLPEKVLELSRPINVKIDLDLLRDLNTADE